MPVNIGPKIGIDGEKEFRSSIQAISQQLKAYGAEMKAVSAEFKNNANSMEALTAKTDVLNKSIAANEQQLKTLNSQYDRQKSKLDDLGKALDETIKQYGENSKEASKAQNAYNRQYQELARLDAQITRANSTLKTLSSELADTESNMKALSTASGKLNTAISGQQSELDGLKNAYKDAVLEFGKGSKQAKSIAGEINKLSTELKKNKDSAKDAESAADALDKSLDDVGSGAEKASGGLSSMNVAMGNLISSGIQAAASAVADLVSSLWNLDESTEEYRIAQGRLNTAFEAAGYGADTAQQAYQAFYGILGDTDTATEASQLLAQLAESEEDVATWTEIAAGVSGTFGDSLPIEGLIEAANETAKVGEVTGTLADALNWVGISEDEFNEKLAACSDESERNQLIMEALSGAYDEASDAFYRNNEVLVQARENQAAMDEVMGNLGATISNLKNSLMNELAPALTGVVNAFNGLLNNEEGAPEQFSASIQALIEQVTAMLPNLISAGTQLLASLVTGIIQAIPTLISSVPEIVGSFITALGEQFPNIVTAGGEVLNQLVTGVEQGIPDMLERIPEVIKNFLDYITSELPNILDKGVEVLSNLIDGIIGSIPDLLSATSEVIGEFLVFIAENLPEILEAGGRILASIIEGIIKAIPDLVASLPKIINAIVNGIGALMGSIINIGGDIVRGVWQGIQNMISWFTNKVKSFFSGIVDSVLGFLGIHSPSRVFADIGENMAAGLGVGWDGEFGSIQRQIDRSMSGLVPEVNGNVNVTGGSAASSQATDITSASSGALSGAIVYMDGRKVGKLITKTQNNDIRSAGLVPTI